MLLYLLEMGSVEQSIAKQAIRSGQAVPDRIVSAPQLKLGLNLYLLAFFDLDTERAHGWSPTRIPWTSIVDYAKANEFDDTQTEDLIFFIRRMDTAHLEKLQEKD